MTCLSRVPVSFIILDLFASFLDQAKNEERRLEKKEVNYKKETSIILFNFNDIIFSKTNKKKLFHEKFKFLGKKGIDLKYRQSFKGDNMKKIFVLCFIILSSILFLQCQSEKKMVKSNINSVNAGDLVYKVKILGFLGYPLGKVIQIEGEILDDSKKSKADEGKTLFKVSSVEGKDLKEPFTISLTLFSFVSPQTPLNPGKKLKIIGYEDGSLTGIPSDAFKHIPRVATTDYHFETFFRVLKVEK